MYEAKVSFVEGDRYNIDMGSSSLTIESAKGGTAPTDVFLASLAGCIAVYARKYLKRTELKERPFSVSIKGELSMDRPVRFKEIAVSLHLPEGLPDGEGRKALLDFVRNCPIHNTIAGHPSVAIDIV